MSRIKHTFLVQATLLAIGVLSSVALFSALTIMSSTCNAAVVTAPYPGYATMLAKLGFYNVPVEHRAAALARFAMEITGYKQMEQWPQWKFVTQKRLNEMMGDGGSYRAVYSAGVMYLKHGYSLNEEPEVFIHEITHHLQVESRGNGCASEYEFEAYLVSDTFSIVTGIGTPMPEALYDKLRSLARSQCGLELP